MKFLYLSPIHPLLSRGNPLPDWQTQSSQIRALRKLGHQVQVFCYTPAGRIQLSWPQRAIFNLRLMLFAWKSKPADAIIFSLGADVILPVVLRLVKRYLPAPLLVLSGVSPIWDGNPREQRLAPIIDLAVTNDQIHARQWEKLGAKRSLVLPISAADPKLHYSRRLKRDIDLLFVGTITRHREKLLMSIKKLLPKTINIQVHQFVWEESYANLMSRAKIVINPLRPEMSQGANLRLFEIPAFGAMQLASHSRDEWFKEGKEIVVYKDAKDAARKIKYYLRNNNLRRQIAQAGQKRAVILHTFEKRFRKLIPPPSTGSGCGPPKDRIRAGLQN